MKPIRVFLVDDHSIITDGIAALFASSNTIEVVGVTNRSEDALLQIHNLLPDVVVTDLNMPGKSGGQLIRQIKKELANQKILVLSMHGDSRIIADALLAGANGFVPKNSGKELLEEAIRQIAEGKRFIPEDMTYDVAESMIVISTEPTKLTEREIEIIGLLEKGFSSKQIAVKLFLSELTVNTHRRNMLRKTGQPNVAALITFAREQNLIL